MENNNTHKKIRSVSENNKRSRDRSKRYSMFYESTENRDKMTNNPVKEDNYMVKSSSLSEIDNSNKKDNSLSLRHAKNLRSSLFMNKDNEMVKYMNENFAEKENRKNKHKVDNEHDKENNFFSSDDDDNNTDENPNEIKTMNIQFSSSPSLSALAGYLQSKDQKTSESKSLLAKTDNNVSLLNRKPYNTPMENIFENEEYEPYQKPEGNKTTENKPKSNDITSLKQQNPILQTINVKKNTLPTNKQQMVRKISEDKPNKKSSIFSIFRKKSVNRSVSDSKYLPVSETFSNKSASKKNSTRDFKGRSSSVDLRQGGNPKVPSRENLPIISNKNDNVPVKRKDVGSLQNSKKISGSNSEASNMTAKSSPKILGEDVFPKHLDISEISSIHTLEKAKRASLTLTPNNKRMSLPDSISIKQENEGMFVEYDSNLHIHTPDLSKSPTSSILRSGRFDNGTNRNSIILSDSGISTNRNSLILSDSGRRSNRNSRYENRNSLLSNSNINGMNSSSQTKLILEEDKKDGPLLDIDFDFEDSEYVSEIMEFKNIIDFGDYINLDFNESPIGDAEIKEDVPVMKDNLVLNGLGILPTNEKNDEVVKENTEILNHKTLAPPLNTDIPKLDTKFSPSSDDPYLPAIDPESPDTPRKMRPLSMSFKGLDLKNNYDNIFEMNEDESEQPNDVEDYDEALQDEAEEESFAEDEDFNFYESDEDAYLDEIHDYVEQNFPTRSAGTSQYGDFENTKPKKKSVSFASKIILFDTYAAEEYDRRPELATCNQLTPELAMFIREEVNNMKSEMDFHEDSIQYIHFL
ncbi:uncharacterized protein HGUI_02297 [Hanseniaspora guilliermondii]|uniref:Protein BNI4 n=1 Tax=Hanseniaspora guilliermondii TaxID=56406 RepID=A0A1L0CNQ6_9ASCO|nr:uncharacterized protein HGUI_02297 [Hanseniaspora guilliermondii]